MATVVDKIFELDLITDCNDQGDSPTGGHEQQPITKLAPTSESVVGAQSPDNGRRGIRVTEARRLTLLATGLPQKRRPLSENFGRFAELHAMAPVHSGATRRIQLIRACHDLHHSGDSPTLVVSDLRKVN
jgi:hypothetical protein